MDFRAVSVLCMAVSELMEEISWAPYGPQQLHTPILQDEKDCRTLDMMLDILGTLTRMMDTRIMYVTTEGKVVREWIECIIEIGSRYRRVLALLAEVEARTPLAGSETK